MGIDEPRQDDLTGKIEYRIGRRGEFSGLANLFDDAVLGVKSSAFQFTALGVHDDKDFGILDEQRGHFGGESSTQQRSVLRVVALEFV